MTRNISGFLRAAMLTLAAFLAFLSTQSLAIDLPPAPAKPSELFNLTTVWTINLNFTREQWDALEPRHNGGGFPFMGGRGSRNEPPPPMGPSQMIAPDFFKDGDTNHDQKLSKPEFASLADKWFSNWDIAKAGKITSAQLREGLAKTFPGPATPPMVRAFGGPRLLGEEGKRNGLASAAGIEFSFAHADFELNGQTIKDVGVRYKGNGTWMQSQNTMKRSIKIDFNHYVKGQKFAGLSKMNLHNNVTDASWMNEPLSYRLYRDANVPSPRSSYARVYVNVPGKYEKEYLGLYSIIEDVDKDFAQENYKSKAGAIFKPVTPDLFADLGNDWAKYKQTYDPKTELTEKQKQRVIDFSKLVTSASDADFAAKLAEFVDLDETARYFAVTVYLATMDSILALGQNYYIYLHPETNKFQFLPWDLDHSFGQFPMIGSQEQRENLSIHRPWRGENLILDRLFKTEAFKKIYLARIDEFNKTIFKPERFQKQIEEIAPVIRPAVKEESDVKLQRFDIVVSGESVEPMGFFGGQPPAPKPEDRTAKANGPRDNGPRGDGPRGDNRFMRGTRPIRAFVIARAQSLIDQIAGKSEGQTLGGNFGPGGDRPNRNNRPEDFGPARFVEIAFMAAFDTNADGILTHDEFTQGFARWFDAWDSSKTGFLNDEQLRAGLNNDLIPIRRSTRTAPRARPQQIIP